MAAEFQKLAKEPLLWVGAAAICVPLFASGMLENLRDRITYGEAVNANLDFQTGSPKIAIAPKIQDSVESDWKDSSVPALPPIASVPSLDSPESFESEALQAESLTAGSLKAELLDSSLASLPTTKPRIKSSLDPGSLSSEAERLGQEDLDVKESQSIGDKKIESKSDKVISGEHVEKDEHQEPDFDFLFGDDPAMAEFDDPESEKPDIEKPPSEERKTEESKVAKNDDASSPSGTHDEPKDFKSPDASDVESSKTTPNQVAETEMKSDSTKQKSVPFSPSHTAAPGFVEWTPQPVVPEPVRSGEFFGQPEQIHREPIQNDYFVEVDSGPDWWTPYCQQPFWGSIPTQHTGLDAVVFSALQNSPFVKLINTEPQMAQTLVAEMDARFDWSAFVDANWSDVDRPVVSLLDTGTAGGRFVQQQFLFESGVQKNLRTGGHLRVGHAWQRTDNNSDFLSPPDQATAQLLLDYRQPLLRGAGKHVNNSQIVLAEIGTETAQNETQALLQQFLVDVVAEYWELHYARGVLVQQMRSAERAEQLLESISSLDDAEKWQRDLIRIRAAATARRTGLIRAQNMVATHQETLMNLTYGTAMPDPSSMEIVPMEAPGSFVLPYDLGQVTEMAVQNRPEVQVALTAIKASAIRQNLVLNDLKPRLDAIVSTFISGVDENKDVGGAFGDAADYNPSYAVGFSFEVPLGRRVANSRIQRQQLDYQRLQHQLEQTLGNVRLDARLAYRNVQSLSSELENHKLAAQQAAQELQSVTDRTSKGLSGGAESASLMIDDLLQSQARLGHAEERLLRSQTDLSVALVQLKRATGQLLQAAPMPQVSDHFVQQANFEQPVNAEQPASIKQRASIKQPESIKQPASVEQPSNEQSWSVPNTLKQAKSASTNDLWADDR
jgi:outer membrane protein TolC